MVPLSPSMYVALIDRENERKREKERERERESKAAEVRS